MTMGTAMKNVKLRATGGLVLAGLFLAGCGLTSNSGRPLTTLDPQGRPADQIHSLVRPVFIVAGIVFVLVEGAVIYLIIRYRRRPDDVDGVDEPVQRHGNNPLEWGWTIAPAILLAILAVGNVRTIWDLERDQVQAPSSVQVIGQQWWWEFRYDFDGDKKVDVITANQLVIPVGEMVRTEIRSNDVIHSFWIPALNGKKDAVPGRIQPNSLQAFKPGIYEGQCTEFCGLSHGYMRMQVKVLSKADYAIWKANQLKGSVEPTAGTEAAEGQVIFQQKCMSCHQINGYDDKGAKLDTTRPNPDYRGASHPLISGNAPNLTHLMSRERFAGNMFDLYQSERDAQAALPAGTPDRSNLGNWLRNPGLMKPMAADQNRGMRNLQLPEDEIRKLVAYLTTLK